MDSEPPMPLWTSFSMKQERYFRLSKFSSYSTSYFHRQPKAVSAVEVVLDPVEDLEAVLEAEVPEVALEETQSWS